MFKNIASQKISVYAHDTISDQPKIGDAGNITVQISKDGGATAASTNSVAELDSTDAPGIYMLSLIQAETNADLMVISAISSTAGIQLVPIMIFTKVVTADIVSAILAGVIEGTLTLKQAQRLMLAVLTGKVSGGGTTEVTFRDTGDSKDRVVATITEVGDRTAVTRDVS